MKNVNFIKRWRKNTMHRNKYHAQICKVGDEVFHSKKELHRYEELCLMEKAGLISGLRRQVKYLLIPAQRETIWKNGKPRQGKVIEREISYTADFVYYENGQVIVEDVKGGNATKTKEYIIKRKLMLYVHGIRLREV
jgi:hypothetical protein